MSGDDVKDMEVEFEGEAPVDNFNNEKLTENAVRLQSRLDQLRIKLNQARSEKNAYTTSYGVNNLYKEVSADDLHRLTEERTKTFLNFSSVQAAIRAAQANQVLTQALQLEKNDDLQLDPEEETYVRELLEEQKELSQVLLKNQEIGVSQEIQIIEARTELGGLLCRYQELRNEAGPVLLREEDKDKSIQILEQQIKDEDLRVNQMRFIIQKLMIGEDKFGQLFDTETNNRFKNMLLRCGMKPDELRREKLGQETGNQN